MEVEEVEVEEVVEEEAIVVAHWDLHLLSEQPLSQLQHPKQDQMAP